MAIPFSEDDIALQLNGTNAYVNLGLLDYNLGEKSAALADFRRAIELDPGVRQQLQAPAATAEGPAGRLRVILEDTEFLKQLIR